MSVIGIIDSGSSRPEHDALFLQALKEHGYAEGGNLAVEFRQAEGRYDRLPMMAAELVARQVSVIVALGTRAAVAAKAASVTVNPAIPVVFSMGGDPVAAGLVAGISRPEANVTGISSIAAALAPKRLELVRELPGGDKAAAILINPENPLSNAERRDAEAASGSLGQGLEVLTAGTVNQLEGVFAQLDRRRIGALIVSVDTFFFGQMKQIAMLAARHRVPTIGPIRRFAMEGGLMSYGTSLEDQRRQVAMYVAKILKRARPADLPVMQATKFELVINLKTARELPIELSPKLLALADEVIE